MSGVRIGYTSVHRLYLVHPRMDKTGRGALGIGSGRSIDGTHVVCRKLTVERK